MESDNHTLILRRLEHVDLIFELRHKYFDINLIDDTSGDGWTHPWMYFDALINYLLLTCFDLLGQSSEWVSFSEWLASKKKATERSAVEHSIQTGSNPVEIARHFNTEYQKIYGVRSSFNRFVSKILTGAERAELYSNIMITRGRMDGDPNTLYPSLGCIDDENKKLDFLFSLRNKFTHRAVMMGSPNAGILSNAYELKLYAPIYQEEINNERLSYQVRDWPFVLKRLIMAALARHETLP